MDFRDEVDTPVDEPARNRFIKFRGVRSLKQCHWDSFENLPPMYSKIFRFKNFEMSKNASIAKTVTQGLPLNGVRVRLTLEPLGEASRISLEKLDPSQTEFLIVSTLHDHECKLSVNHFDIRRMEENQEIIQNKSVFEFHVGFRRFILKPCLSQPIQHSDKLKMSRFF